MTNPKFVMERTFDAPKSLVWRTWTEADLVERWYGPGVETVIHEFSPEPGGLWLNEMRMGDNSMYQRMEYTDVVPTDRLVMLMSNADENWNVVPSPMMPDWPKVLLTTITFQETGAETKLTLTWEPHNPTEAEIATFAKALPDLDKGWGKGMEIIAEILEELAG
ncbi:MAG: SRPBCC domain-containing protein [Silicimonas sp.]|nr:SRPBCC domain-containing protein [Silicimonas sp.]